MYIQSLDPSTSTNRIPRLKVNAKKCFKRIYGRKAAPILTFNLQRRTSLSIPDISRTLLCLLCDDAIMPNWFIVRNRPFIHTVCLIAVEGFTIEDKSHVCELISMTSPQPDTATLDGHQHSPGTAEILQYVPVYCDGKDCTSQDDVYRKFFLQKINRQNRATATLNNEIVTATRPDLVHHSSVV